MVGEIKFVHDLLDRRLTLLHLPRCGSKVSHMVINNVISHCPMYIGPLMLQYIKVPAKFFLNIIQHFFKTYLHPIIYTM